MLFVLLFQIYSIPKRTPGLVWGTKNPLIVLDLYCDPLCSDCLTTWPTMKTLLTKYDKSLQLRLHLLPLPSHTWAFSLMKGVMGLKSISETKAMDMIDSLYSGDQSLFSTTQLMKTPESDVIVKICQYISNKFKVDYQTIYNAYNDQGRKGAGTEFAYSTIHSIIATPTFEVNGIKDQSLNEETTLEQWYNYIDSFIKP